MSKLIQDFEKKYHKKEVPVIRPGYEVAVHQKIKEGNKERVQLFKGMVIAVNPGNGLNETFTVRKISDGIGVEKVFCLHSPNIVKIDVLRAYRVRRAKLYYLRDLSGKALRLPEIPLKLETRVVEMPAASKKEEVKSEVPTEEVVAEETPAEDVSTEALAKEEAKAE